MMPYPSNFPARRESHEIEQIFTKGDKNFICRNCLIKWKRKPNHGKCVGVPVYEDWSNVPSTLCSKTSMYRDHKRKLPEGALPVAAVRTEQNSFTPLYLVQQGNPNYERKRKTTKPTLPPIEPKTKQKEFDPFGWLEEDHKK